MEKADIGLIGLGVMGQNLALNLANKGWKVVVWNRTVPGKEEMCIRDSRNPSQVTILSPLVTYLFTFVAGTGHVAYSVLPVIAEVATETKIRPERPLGIAVIASQQAITASPIGRVGCG